MSKQEKELKQINVSRAKVPDSAHFYVSENEIDMELLDRQASQTQRRGIDFSQYLKIILFGFQFNIQKWMNDSDPTLMSIVNQVLKMTPGYKSTQYIFTYYLITSNILNAFAMALLYPLPYAILFTYLGFFLEDAQANQDWQYSALVLIILTGVRSSLIALLAKYALVLPEGKFYWVVFVSTIIIAAFFRNNYVYFILYVISIFLSFYVKEDARPDSRNSASSLVLQDQRILKQYRQIKGIPYTYPALCVAALLLMIIGIWLYQRYTQNWKFIVLLQFVMIGLLNNTKVMLIFYPLLFNAIYSIPHLKATDIIGINFMLPGSHIKPFFSFIGNDFDIFTFVMTYLCLYLPSILIACIYIGYRKHFYSVIWDNSMKAMQAVSNGLIISMIGYILVDQQCNFSSILYSAICIFCVVQLYNLRQIVGTLLGIFLIFSRAGVLYLNKGEPFSKFVCLQQSLQ